MLLLLACQGANDDRPQPTTEGPCAAASSELHATAIGVRASSEGCGQIDLGNYRVLGEGTFQIDLFTDARQVLVRVKSTADGSVFRGFAMDGGAALAGEEPIRLWRQGYQSRSASGVFETGPLELGPEGVPVSGGDGDDLDDERPGTSWWAGLAGRADGASVLVGVHSARSTKFTVGFDADGAMWAVWGNRGESLPLDDGDYVWLDPLYAAIGPDPNELWRGWAEAASAANQVQLRPEPPPVGVAADGDAGEEALQTLLSAASASNAAPGRAPIGRLQVGRGWQLAMGDWTSSAAWPSGTAALADEIAASGLAPGLWMAPFLVDRSTSAYVDHPDWWVRDAGGAELDWLGHAVLDATHPDAALWLGDQIASRVAEGWTVLELDHLAAGALEGQRYAPVTGTAALSVGLGLVRAAAGDAWLVGNGAPLLPSAGYVDVYRTGPDVALPQEPDPRREVLRGVTRSTVARGFTNGRLWWTDPGPLQVAEPSSLVAVHGAVVASAVSAGAWTIGPDLATLPAERLDLALGAGVTGLLASDVRPEDPLAFVSGWSTAPAAALTDDRVPVRHSFEDGATALLALGDAPLEIGGPGGTEVLDGEEAAPGPRTLAPGDGEIWR